MDSKESKMTESEQLIEEIKRYYNRAGGWCFEYVEIDKSNNDLVKTIHNLVINNIIPTNIVNDTILFFYLGRHYQSYHVDDKGAFLLSEKYYLLAVEKGFVEAMYALGTLYHGNLDKQIEWFKMATDKGDLPALRRLCECYAGKSDDQNVIKYHLLLNDKIGDNNDGYPLYQLGLYFGKRGDSKSMIKYKKQSAEQYNNYYAMLDLITYYKLMNNNSELLKCYFTFLNTYFNSKENQSKEEILTSFQQSIANNKPFGNHFVKEFITIKRENKELTERNKQLEEENVRIKNLPGFADALNYQAHFEETVRQQQLFL